MDCKFCHKLIPNVCMYYLIQSFEELCFFCFYSIERGRQRETSKHDLSLSILLSQFGLPVRHDEMYYLCYEAGLILRAIRSTDDEVSNYRLFHLSKVGLPVNESFGWMVVSKRLLVPDIIGLLQLYFFIQTVDKETQFLWHEALYFKRFMAFPFTITLLV